MQAQAHTPPTVSNPLHLLDAFCKRLEAARNEDIRARYPSLHDRAINDGFEGYHAVKYIEGGRFWKVYIEINTDGQYKNGSVCYFVERSTGVIFGASGWKAYNPVHEYGNLETIDEWDWAPYYAVNKNGKDSKVPKQSRR
jgi:hypothetical protein